MVDNVARRFAILQLIVGFLLFCFGIGEQVVGNLVSQHMYLGIGAGIWVFIAGCLGIPDSRRDQSTLRSVVATASQCFSAFSVFLGGALVGVYSVMIVLQPFSDYHYRRPDNENSDARIAIFATIIVLGGLECCIACGMTIRITRQPPQRPIGFPVTSQMQLSSGSQGGQPQALHTSTTSGYQPQRIDMPPSYEEGDYVTQQNQQASSGVPVAVRMQAGATFVADQTVTPEPQDNQPQVVLLPDSREMDGPPPPYEVAVSGYQTLQDDMPPSYERAPRDQWKSYV